MKIFYEAFNSRAKQKKSTEVYDSATARRNYISESAKLQTAISSLSTQIEKENQNLKNIANKMFPLQEQKKELLIKSNKDEISDLLKEETQITKAIQNIRDRLGIDLKLNEIKVLNEECENLQIELAIAAETLLAEIAKSSKEFQEWVNKFTDWIKSCAENNVISPEQLTREIESLKDELPGIKVLEEFITEKEAKQRATIEELYKITQDEVKIRESRASRQNWYAIIRIFIDLFVIIINAGDPLQKLSAKKETLEAEKKNLSDSISTYEQKLQKLKEDKQKIAPLELQLNLLKKYQKINQATIEVLELEQDDTLKDLLHKQKTIADKKTSLEIEQKSINKSYERIESSIEKLKSAMDTQTAQIQKLEKEKLDLSNQLQATINSIQELDRLLSKPASESSIREESNTNALDIESSHSEKTATTVETVEDKDSLKEAPHEVIKNPSRVTTQDSSRYTFFNKELGDYKAYNHLLNRKTPNYFVESKTFTPMNNIELHTEQLNKSHSDIIKIVSRTRTLIKNLEEEASSAQSTSSETTKYAEEIRLLQELNEALNIYNIFITMPLPNFSLIQEKSENIIRILNQLKTKSSDSYTFKVQLNASNISIETVEKSISTQQKILISKAIEEYLQQIKSQETRASDKATKKRYTNLKDELEKYQSLILIPKPDSTNLNEYRQAASQSLENIKSLHTNLSLSIRPIESALNAGGKIIGIDEEPNPSANIGLSN